MSSPAANSRGSKKRKHDEPARKPIVFHARSLDLDTRLNVLGQEFHVHSSMLKVRSAFFFKFLDSPEKVPITDGLFKYEWVSKIDADGSWSLVAASPGNNPKLDFSKFKGSITDAITDFENLLHAMYGEPFRHTDNVRQLIEITDLADYYLALPALSNSLAGLMAQGDLRITDRSDAECLIEVAVKLRHAGLFRDCVCALASFCYLNDEEDEIPNLDRNLHKIVKAARAQIFELIVRIDDFKVQMKAVDGQFSDAYHYLNNGQTRGGEKVDSLYSYHKELGRIMRRMDDEEAYLEPLLCIDSLLKVNMISVHGRDETPDFLKERFLCAKVDDEDLPWDLEQKDW